MRSRALKFLFLLFLCCIGGLGWLIYDQGKAELIGMAITEGRCDGSNCDAEVVNASAQKLVDAGLYDAAWKARWCEGAKSIETLSGKREVLIEKLFGGVSDISMMPCPETRA